MPHEKAHLDGGEALSWVQCDDLPHNLRAMDEEAEIHATVVKGVHESDDGKE